MPTLEAKITKVEHDISTGWYRIATDGEPKRMDTKIREKAEEAARLMKEGTVAVIEFSENPRTVDGRTYRNARYERAEARYGGPTASASGIETVAPQQQQQAQVQRRRDPDESWRIMLQTGAKLAVATLPYLPPEQHGFDAQRAIAVAWANFFASAPRAEQRPQAPPPSPDQAPASYVPSDFAPFAQAQAAQEARTYENDSPVYADDDIPF